MLPIQDLQRAYAQHSREYEEAALRVMRGGSYILGGEVRRFEQDFAAFCGTSHCVGVGNGFSAIYLGLKALGIGEGDEVILPVNSFYATVLAVVLLRATPVFTDVNAYYNIDPAKIEQAVTEKTKAVLLTHFYGQACEMEPIRALCEQKGVDLLEDCSHAHGAAYAGRKTGAWGKMGFFSFYPTKPLGAFGDGGAVTTDDDALAEKLRFLRNYGKTDAFRFEYDGVNSRLDALQAALLSVKLRYLQQTTAERARIAGTYDRSIRNAHITLPRVAPRCSHAYYLYVIEADDRDDFMAYMRRHQIETRVHYPEAPFQTNLCRALGVRAQDYPVFTASNARIVSVPLFNGMTEDEISQVTEVINRYG